MEKLDNSEKQPIADSQWKRPNDVMKKIRIRKRRTFPVRSNSVSQSTLSLKNNENLTVKDKLRLNPFSKKRSFSETNESSGKKRILSESENNSSETSWAIPEASSFPSCFDSVSKEVKADKDVLSNDDLGFVYLNEDSIQGIFNEPAPKEPEPQFEAVLPPDWSIKTKVRVLSPSTFAWCARMRGGEEARSLARSTRCDFSEMPSGGQSELRVRLGSCLAYFQQPSVPWLKLYPRFGADVKLLPRSSGEPIKDEGAKSSLYDSWVASFRSAFQHLCQQLCPYFYVCSQQYTALFISAALSCNDKVVCFLTPTSLGFRNSLKSEGIEFTMPLQPPVKQQSAGGAGGDNAFMEGLRSEGKLQTPFPSSRVGGLGGKEDETDKVDIDEEEELSWRRISDGLHFRKNKEVTVATKSDGLPRTAVAVEGKNNAQMLFNFLLNCRSSISTSGPQTGVPPTILSPTPFLGSTLKRLEYRAGIAKVNDESTPRCLQHRFTLDISGPLLPHQVHEVARLLSATQEGGGFTLALGTQMHSAPFNAPRGFPGVDDVSTNREREQKCDNQSEKSRNISTNETSEPKNEHSDSNTAASNQNSPLNCDDQSEQRVNIVTNQETTWKCGVSESFLARFKSKEVASTLRQVKARNGTFNFSN